MDLRIPVLYTASWLCTDRVSLRVSNLFLWWAEAWISDEMHSVTLSFSSLCKYKQQFPGVAMAIKKNHNVNLKFIGRGDTKFLLRLVISIWWIYLFLLYCIKLSLMFNVSLGLLMLFSFSGSLFVSSIISFLESDSVKFIYNNCTFQWIQITFHLIIRANIDLVPYGGRIAPISHYL